MRCVTAIIALSMCSFFSCKGNFVRRAPCDGVDCSDHGRCFDDDDEGTAICVCDPGFHAEGLDCAADMLGGDGDSDADIDADGDVDVDADTDDDVITCTPDCVSKECGSDGCGGFCPPGCPDASPCDEVSGTCTCVPDCVERECGSDGCGGDCGPGCLDHQTCSESGYCHFDCEHNAGWSTSCSTNDCEDGSPCLTFPELGDEFGGICSPNCIDDTDCAFIAPGEERCLDLQSLQACVVLCQADADCPCGLSCRELEGLDMRVCYP